jgi:hypothetical protein
MERDLIKTSHSNTISMTLEEGDMFADSNTWLEVRNFNNRYLGYITGEYFRDNRYHRTVNDAIIWVCPFMHD